MTNENRTESVNAVSLRNELLDEALTRIAARPATRVYNDGSESFSPIPAFAKGLKHQGTDVVFGTEPFEGKLPDNFKKMASAAASGTPSALLIVKDLFGDLVFACHREFSKVERAQQRAVEGKGVEGIEQALDTTGIDATDIDPFETANAIREVLDDVYPAFNTLYQAALAKLGYKVEMLPWASEQIDGEWIGVLSFDEARRVIEARRVANLEQKRAAASAMLDQLLSVEL